MSAGYNGGDILPFTQSLLPADGYSCVESFQLNTDNARPAPSHLASTTEGVHADWTPSARDVIKTLRDRLAAEMARLPLGRHEATANALTSLILPLPQRPTAIAQLPGAQFQFLHPQGESLRAGYGQALHWEAQGPQRLSELARITHDWPHCWEQLDPGATGLKAFAMLGFAAAPNPVTHPITPPVPPENANDDLPNALLWVPDIALRQTAEQAALIFTAPQRQTRTFVQARWHALLEALIPRLFPPPRRPALVTRVLGDSAEPEATEWTRLVELALARIQAGDLQKVVLSRRLKVSGSRSFDIARLLDVLAAVFPSCQIINLRHHGSSFVAATPERLLHLRNGRLAVDAIAGTTEHCDCEDRNLALGQELLRSEKNLREHGFVVDAVARALTPFCRSIHVPTQPELMRLRNAQHLWSPITAEIDPGTDFFDLADRLHPTPATNGQPRLAAHHWLREHEPFSRGWYTGAAGFIEPGTGGELWVLLRCARIRGKAAELHAGAGIVAGSDPQAEWEETEAKLAAMLTALRFA
ncbi:isochorismate synthase [Thiorhodovibrio frisius]|uniref:isochorismate synthase n=1 Tax=Thiorhodovibrio frisius TaxID=631362 RepID=H8YWV2_9GAMM|nr:isochorismate synthase [Thiorhodovibrio frisius]EIC22928.1 isochorismate synthase family protein [Thiorhodovibrio frisius]WPL22813.1 Menaquinone-specific isochorismate synthase [Thiorhodovibrio frisius]